MKVENSHIKFLGVIFLATVLAFTSCKKDSEYVDIRPLPYKLPLLPDEPFDYSTETAPPHFLNDPLFGLFNIYDGDDGVTNHGATLGRVLFYDKNLSKNNTIACASCHHQDKAFTDGLQFSRGVHKEFTDRNSMSIFNVKLNRRLFWDIRASNAFTQVLEPIENPIEMDMNVYDLVDKLGTLPYYAELFENAFGDSEVTVERIRQGLAQFIISIDSHDSKYDKGIENGFVDYTELEIQGKDLFLSGVFKCNQCHTTSNLGGINTMNNGLDSILTDLGQGGVTFDEADNGEFKATTLRNIELTAPYMHDGRFATLDEVLDFYSTDVQWAPNLDDRLTEELTMGGTPLQFNFTDLEKEQLIAFLKTLTDPVLISEPKWSDPFEY